MSDVPVNEAEDPDEEATRVTAIVAAWMGVAILAAAAVVGLYKLAEFLL